MDWNSYIAARGGHVLLEEQGRPLTVAEFMARAKQEGENLEWLGISNPGGITSFIAAPTVHTVIYLFAVIHGGSIALPLNPHYPPDYLQRIEAGMGGQLPGLPGDAIDAHGPATVIMTSGSSSFPKGVVHSLAQHLASAEAANANIPLGPGSRWLLSLPLYHVSGIAIVFRCLAGGATAVVPEAGADLLTAIQALRITHCSMVAAQLQRCMDTPGGAVILAGLDAVLLGGSAIPGALVIQARAAGIPVHTSYGMTETASQICCTAPGDPAAALVTAGRPLGPDRVRIAEDGAIEVGGPSLMLGYWSAAGLERPFTQDGWLPSGDRGHWDDAGRLCITGRLDNMFISGGENVQPEEIERVLTALNGVKQAIVVPASHREFGVVAVAIIETEDNLDTAEAVWREALSKQLPRHAVPKCCLPWPMDHTQDTAIKVSREKLRLYAEAMMTQRGLH